jgi:hypothetical protein
MVLKGAREMFASARLGNSVSGDRARRLHAGATFAFCLSTFHSKNGIL